MYQCVVFTDRANFTEDIQKDLGGTIMNILSDRSVLRELSNSSIQFIGDSSVSFYNTLNNALLFVYQSYTKIENISYGIACGEVITADNSKFGTAVNVASKLGEDIATKGQILLEGSLCQFSQRLLEAGLFNYCEITNRILQYIQ